VALRFQHRLALGRISHLAAIAPAFQLHGILPDASMAVRGRRASGT
jgi:hypothetical protein